jgi:hypothetical protein
MEGQTALRYRLYSRTATTTELHHFRRHVER